VPADLDDRALGLLRTRDSWTAPALASLLGVSLRTVRRVLARLTATGVPLETEPGRGGGVRLAGAVGLQRLRLEHREVLDLLLALAIAESLGSPLLLTSARAVRQKLGLALPEGQQRAVAALRRRILIGRPASAAVRASLGAHQEAVLAPLQDAFFASAPLRITYLDGQGLRSEREVEPQYLLLNHPAWYLLAYDRSRLAGRTLRLDRILEAEPGPGTFEPRLATQLLGDVASHFDEL
jgi:predicted DNA-binding transcriptional regulator YafY